MQVLCPPESDPLAAALARSTTQLRVEEPEQDLETSQIIVQPVHWECQIIITKPPPAPVGKKGYEPEHLIRANTLAGYWEMNRRFIKQLAAMPRAPYDSPAQISVDSLVAESCKIGERASLKKTIVGRHCVIGRGAKLSGCILWDFCTVDEK
jgi:translation initiation factor eIF-2B subunit gamma